MNQQAKYLGQRSFNSKVIFCPYTRTTQRQTYRTDCSIPRPLSEFENNRAIICLSRKQHLSPSNEITRSPSLRLQICHKYSQISSISTYLYIANAGVSYLFVTLLPRQRATRKLTVTTVVISPRGYVQSELAHAAIRSSSRCGDGSGDMPSYAGQEVVKSWCNPASTCPSPFPSHAIPKHLYWGSGDLD